MIDKGKERLKKSTDSLKSYKNRTDSFLREYLDEKIRALREIDALLGGELGEMVKSAILNGGKRMRAAFVYYGYRAVGGKDEEKILFVSAAIEILHSFFLIHDDIIDKSDLRRGMPTIHKRYQQIYEDKGLLNDFDEPDKKHFASSVAIMAGDICSALAYEALVDSRFEERRIIEALKMMQETVRLTGVGEMLDIVKSLDKKATEEEVSRIHYLKTAKYTVESPLHLGAIAQGTTGEILSSFSKYGAPVGIAFQIHDDILGIFGTEKQLGKPISSDIQEGKQTLLTVKAFQKASAYQKEKMNSLLGNPNITNEDVEEFKRIIEHTGALDYSRDKAAALVEEGKAALSGVPIQEDIKETLLGMADFVIGRQY